MNGQMDKEGEWSRSIVISTAVENPKALRSKIF
jgi:hypothetical protein